MAHAMMAPTTPVWAAKRAGSWKTPAPTIDPITMAVSAGRLSLFVFDWSGTVSVALSAVVTCETSDRWMLTGMLAHTGV
jgi:hypothetical protein